MNIEEIKAREQAATPGPWMAFDDEIVDAHEQKCGPRYTPIASRIKSRECWFKYGDASFIAHARTDIPALLAEVERLTAIIDAYATSARVISLYLEDFCNPNLAYSEMIADASRKASQQITILKKALELACDSKFRYMPKPDYFIHQAQQLTHETRGESEVKK